MALKNSLFIHTKIHSQRIYKQYVIISFCFEMPPSSIYLYNVPVEQTIIYSKIIINMFFYYKQNQEICLIIFLIQFGNMNEVSAVRDRVLLYFACRYPANKFINLKSQIS